MTTTRVAALSACVAAWLWLWSIYTPWAADRAPRLWLYDVLYYARVLLVAWIALTSTWWALLGMAGAVPGVAAAQDVLEHAYGKGLIPVLQLTSLTLLLTGLGLGIGFVLG